MADHQQNRIAGDRRPAFAQQVADAIATIATSLHVLRRIQYDAPWRTEQRIPHACARDC